MNPEAPSSKYVITKYASPLTSPLAITLGAVIPARSNSFKPAILNYTVSNKKKANLASHYLMKVAIFLLIIIGKTIGVPFLSTSAWTADCVIELRVALIGVDSLKPLLLNTSSLNTHHR
jgi:hypothetical protein